MENEKQSNLDNWHAHLDTTKNNIQYSQKRMDVLIISLGSGSLYVIFETLKGFSKNSQSVEFSNVLLSAGIFLGLAIITNFISQFTSTKANQHEENYIHFTISKIEDNGLCDNDKKKRKQADSKSKIYDSLTTIFNVGSMISLCLGIVLLAIFFFMTF